MLKQTFLHLKGVGKKGEQKLYEEGIYDWELYRQSLSLPLFKDFSDSVSAEIEASIRAYEARDSNYFASRLPSSEHYRIALAYPDDTVFLDIETTGLSHYYDIVTVIGVSYGRKYRYFLKDGDLKELKEILASAKCIVTFNGTIFDIPFLRKLDPKLSFPLAHVDLRFFGRRAGLVGGQKSIEDQIGLKRSWELKNIKGRDAVLLWYDFLDGNKASLEKLIAYNHADIEGMKLILDTATKKVAASHPANLKNPSFTQLKSQIEWQPIVYKRSRKKRFKFSDFSYTDYKVVGIDLTGSEKRATGWCLLRNNSADIRSLSTDDELIQATVAAKPDLVSIDSPLSLPTGRISVFDDDPGRKEYGIMRVCERILKRRGVNVYPCLLPSMQRLTARGIRIAEQLRKMGIPVIESYPGAAQDIMGIPRKGAGIELLKKGLNDFGIKGDLLKGNLSHDELDALTSAIVGFFFLNGRYEGLGNEEEEFLIIPDLKIKPGTQTPKVLGISGPTAAGKTTAGKYLAEEYCHYLRFSKEIETIAKETNVKVLGRKSLQVLGEKMHREKGQRWIAKRMLSKIHDMKPLVIDGLRFPEDHAFLKERFGPNFYHLHIEATPTIRKRRYLSLGRTAKEFDAAVKHPVEGKIGELKNLAQAVISNNNSKAQFLKQAKKLKSSFFSV